MAIKLDEMRKLVSAYDSNNLTIATIGSHSALDICDGAKEEGFKTLVVCQKGREKTYKRFKRIVDETLVLDKFSDMVKPEVQKRLTDSNSLFIPNRSFSTYVGYNAIENDFKVPLLGSRMMLRSEEREIPKNQYQLLEIAGIRYPKKVKSPAEIRRLSIVKIQESERKLERAFFTCSSPREYEKKVEDRVRQGLIKREDLKNSTIEEFVIGALFNFNFFYSPLNKEIDFLGADRRLQTNLDGILHLTADQQLEIKLVSRNIEIGHMLATVRESMLERVFEMGEKFVEATKKEYPPGIIGPFALQGAVDPNLEITIFDVSPRVPGSPVLEISPYGKHYFGHFTSTGRRIAMEVAQAAKENRLAEVVT
ncbi:5-formaminoimidazole-4-carboxamide-1-(beta)-D-ribofuranosyl 5'-monophosphate synthetase [Candidatus Micrarchaeota archaeon]|nr:MAG: 5-formaminoimidazole-4-carboxamide-1-(beta)-D-ribofuranosyl 5'-monophosphate synthetase [Candidatus Micrarchaeota archaeon]